MCQACKEAVNGCWKAQGWGPRPQVCGGVGLHDFAQVRLQGLEDELRIIAGNKIPVPLCWQASKTKPAQLQHRRAQAYVRRTPCLPRQKTKLRGSPFLAGSANFGTCVRVLRCIATGNVSSLC